MRSALLCVVCILILLECECRGHRRRSHRTRRSSSGLPPHLQIPYQRAVSNTRQNDSGQSVRPTTTTPPPQSEQGHNITPDWLELVPTLPAPDDVECYIEVVSVERRGGRCVKLGGSTDTYICQSGPNFEFSDACGQRLENRNISGP